MADTMDNFKSSTAFIKEPSPDDPHPDLDTSNPVNLTRLAALFQTGWTLSRGRGPRAHDHCLWCRGPMSDCTQILVHTHLHSQGLPLPLSRLPGLDYGSGTGFGMGSATTTTVAAGAGMGSGLEATPKFNSSVACKNAWPVSCFLVWISSELDRGINSRAGARFLRCPMCRCEFHHRRFYFLVHDFAKPEPNFVPAAWFRVVLLSPEYVEGRRRQQQLAADQENEERLTVMDRTEVAKLPLFGRNKCFFQSIDGMVVGKRDHKQERESRKEPTHDLPHEQEHVQDQEREKVQEEGPQDHVFNTWVLLDCGNNEFHMTPIPKPLSWNSDDKSIDNDHAKAEIFTPTGLSATDLVNEATSKGGLAVALQAFVSDGTAKDQHPPLEELKAEGRTYYRRQIRICHENLRAAVDESVTNAYRQRIIWYATLLEYLFMSIQTNEEEFAMINYFDDDSQQEEEDEDGEGSKITAHGDGVAPWEDEDPLEDDSSLDEESDA